MIDIPTEREMRALLEASYPNAMYNKDDLRSLYEKLQPAVIAAEARRHHNLTPYQQGREAKAKGWSMDSSYAPGTLGDRRFVAGYRGEADLIKSEVTP